MKKNNIKNGSPATKVNSGLKNPDSLEALAGNILAPLIEHAKERGAKARVAEMFNVGLTEPVRYTTIVRWLDEDPQKRIEPGFGAGLRLLQVWREIAKSKSLPYKLLTTYLFENQSTQ